MSSFNLYDAIMPGFQRQLQNLDAWLTKAEQHATTTSTSPDDLVSARIHTDMHPLPFQVQSFCNQVKFFITRCTSTDPASFTRDDTEKTFAELHQRIHDTLEFSRTVTREDFNEAMTTTEETRLGDGIMVFKNPVEYATVFLVPNAYFHLAMVYAILRKEGVPLGKADYLMGGVEEFAGRTGERKGNWKK